MMTVVPSCIQELSIAIWPLLFGILLSPLLSENPALSQHLPTATLAYRGQPTTELLNSAGDPSSAHSLSLWTRTVYPENSQIMIFWPYTAYPTSLSLLISSPTVCHHSSGTFALFYVGHSFFQASNGQPNAINWDLWQDIKSCVIGLFSLFQLYILH